MLLVQIRSAHAAKGSRFIADLEVLDVVCGHGYPYLGILVSSGFDVSGIGIFKELVRKAPKNVQSRARNQWFMILRIDHHDESLDAVYCFWSLKHFRSHFLDMGEMLRNTKKSALLI
jgi:2-polyprenyl-3-methyl-5-hydroxy-6-metoxy-1,4-benzoquinol methylase